jgi:hypothetical protein
LLRSPKASEGSGGALGEATAKERGNMVGLRDQIKDLVNLPTPTVSDQYTANLSSTQQSEGSLHSVTLAQIVNRADLLPTPNTMEHLPARSGEAKERQLHRGGSNSRRTLSGNLREDILEMLPTPLTTDYKQTDCAGNWNRHSPPLGTIVHGPWGRFEPAIRRWEDALGRPAPAPTNPDGKDGNHRLSSKFTEWMMGLPDGWITDVGLTRNEELKACGNGVVPQQAKLALTQLLKGITL